PELQTFSFGLAFFLLVIFIIYGGFRTIVGFSVFSLFILLFIIPLFLYTIPYAKPLYLSPILSHSPGEIFNGVVRMTYSFLGFEIILFIFPFLKAPKKSKKWAFYGLLFTTCFYTYLAILTYMYFPEKGLEKIIWASLQMWKIIEMPFVERFEYIGIAAWFIIILPNVCYYLWISSRLFKQSFSVRQKVTVPIFACLCLIAMSLFTNRNQINMLIDTTAKAGLYLTYIYLPILFILVLIARKVKKRA
ncbi:GerAB/ArcD/ProY family transporter, partial [Pallidibacillus pasinlerensis]